MTCLVSAVVLAFGKEELLRECLRALVVALERVPGEAELLVVGNALSDEGRRGLRDTAPDAVLIEPGRNLGFAAGVTVALAQARGEWIALVNDDCVVEPEALAELLAAGAQGADVGSVAAQVRFAARPEIINSAGLEIDELGIAYERLLGARVTTSAPDTVEVFGASGATALYRRAMIDAVGGFDSSFFAYLEDADLAWRARMQGWRCLYAPRAVSFHHHSVSLGHSSRAKHFLVGRNRVRMLAKNATTTQLLRWGLVMFSYDFAYILFVAARRSTLAPLRGRLRGLHEWRSYRAAGSAYRTRVALARPSGLREALRRNRVYNAS